MPAVRGTDESGNVTFAWNGSTYMKEEWDKNIADMKARFTIIPEKIRSKIPNKNDKLNCWDQIAGQSVSGGKYSGVPAAFLGKFRIDMYGNAVHLKSSNEAITSFDVDHIFPRSRGGKSVRMNFAAVQTYANRTIKRDKMVPWLDPEKMKCGVQKYQLLAMVDFIIDEEGVRRKDEKAKLDYLFMCLTAGPPKTKES